MPLILRIPKPLSLENMPQVTPTVITHNLRPAHAQTVIRPLAYSSRDSVPKGRPAAAGVKFVVGFIEGRVAASAGVDAGRRVVLVVLTAARGFGAFFA